jgi:predicted Rossmann-fold nucleotide-binding protein
MNMLTRGEIDALLDASQSGLYDLFRRCALAVLNMGSDTDNVAEILERHRDFALNLTLKNGAIELEIENAPDTAFVDGAMMVGIRELLYATLRDILFVHNEVSNNPRFDLEHPAQITDAVFYILRNADVLRPRADSRLVVCWGGHSISREEYDYTKRVGYQLGLRRLDICTGCGPGAMKGPMKGATIGHSKQRVRAGRYVGITEPGIIAAEAPNPIVNELVIAPDIEKRLESFLRLGHGFVIFPGGVGTAEELLCILGVLLHPGNQGDVFPLVLTGPRSAEAYFRELDAFIGETLGPAAQAKYEIVIDDPVAAARAVQSGVERARAYRQQRNDASYFHWQLEIAEHFQRPFHPTHESMAALELEPGRALDELAADLRRAFSGIVAANIKEAGIQATEDDPFVLHGRPEIVKPLQRLLDSFVTQGRMTLRLADYAPRYRIEERAGAVSV